MTTTTDHDHDHDHDHDYYASRAAPVLLPLLLLLPPSPSPVSLRYTIRRDFCAANNSSKWKINGQVASAVTVEKLVAALGIQLANLCTFLPQDKVQEFSCFNSMQLLTESERALAGEKLIATHHRYVVSRGCGGAAGRPPAHPPLAPSPFPVFKSFSASPSTTAAARRPSRNPWYVHVVAVASSPSARPDSWAPSPPASPPPTHPPPPSDRAPPSKQNA